MPGAPPRADGSPSRSSISLPPGARPARPYRMALFLFLLPSAFCLRASAQYSLDWSTIDSGGGTSTDGVYSLSGTIGQPDAGGRMTNGQYSVTGGFWVLPAAVQVTNAPRLTIVPAAPGQGTISWTPNAPGVVLQETWSLSPANWTNSPSGSANPVTVPALPPARFYRLSKP
jgi:hypothetical protein